MILGGITTAYLFHGVVNEKVAHRDKNAPQDRDQSAHHSSSDESAFLVTAGHDGEQQPGPTLTAGASGTSIIGLTSNYVNARDPRL